MSESVGSLAVGVAGVFVGSPKFDELSRNQKPKTFSGSRPLHCLTSAAMPIARLGLRFKAFHKMLIAIWAAIDKMKENSI